MPLMHYDGRDMQADHVLTAAQGGQTMIEPLLLTTSWTLSLAGGSKGLGCTGGRAETASSVNPAFAGMTWFRDNECFWADIT